MIVMDGSLTPRERGRRDVGVEKFLDFDFDFDFVPGRRGERLKESYSLHCLVG